MLKMSFKRKKAFFFTIFCFFIIFSNFYNIDFFSVFCQKNLGNHVKEKMPPGTHCRNQFPHVSILQNFKVFSRKNYVFFPKNAKFWAFWEILLYQSHSTANLLQFDKKRNFRLYMKRNADVCANAIGKHRVEKNSEIADLRVRACFHF